MSPIIYGGSTSGGSTPVRNVGQVELDFVNFTTNGNVPLVFADGDATMVNLADPTYPHVVPAGIYAFTVTITASTGVGLSYGASLLVDDNYYSILASTSLTQADPSNPNTLTTVWFCDAADPFRLSFSGNAGVVVSGRVFLQKIA